MGIDGGNSIREAGGCGCCPWVDFVEVEGGVLLLGRLRDGIKEVVGDACEVISRSNLSRSPKAPVKTWIVIPSSVPVSTPINVHHQPCNLSNSA